MYHDLTKGSISRSLLLFALPMMAGRLLSGLLAVVLCLKTTPKTT